jgi:antitoxin component YwqK of YwqJK toxin-antitoxin module
MRKIYISFFFIFFFPLSSVYSDIPRSSINQLEQLTWTEIIDSVSETYQYAMMVDYEYNRDGSLFFYPSDEKYGKLSSNGLGQYKFRSPEFNGLNEYIGKDVFWSVDKNSNRICYGELKDLIDEHSCVFIFKGFEKNKMYLYFSLSQDGNFYAKINNILKIENETNFDQWSKVSNKFSEENISNVKEYDVEFKNNFLPDLDFSLSDFCFLQPGIQKRNDLYYFPNQEDGISATSICIYKNAYGQYHSKGDLIEGIMDGNWNWWYKNGQKEKKAFFKDNFPDKVNIWWYKNGQTRKMMNLENNWFEGTQTSWYEDGQVKREISYLDGMKEGKNTLWYPNGQKIKELTYQNDELVFETKFIYDDEVLIAERNYKDGEIVVD